MTIKTRSFFVQIATGQLCKEISQHADTLITSNCLFYIYRALEDNHHLLHNSLIAVNSFAICPSKWTLSTRRKTVDNGIAEQSNELIIFFVYLSKKKALDNNRKNFFLFLHHIASLLLPRYIFKRRDDLSITSHSGNAREKYDYYYVPWWNMLRLLI